MAETRSIDGGPAVARPWLYKAAKFLSGLSKLSLYLAGVGLVAMTAIVAWQVFSRYVLNWSNAWTELGSILIMSWFIFLGAAVGVRENYHLGFDVLLYVLPEGSKKVLRTISDGVVFAFAIGMVFFGWQLVVLQWNERMPSLGISGSFRYVPLVAGGALIALFSAERILLRWSGVEVDQDLHERDDFPTVDPVKEL